ncbi:uncharacterized protein V1478_004316 [Vespula squamosa]|uniref:Uncharacterized protein n=1 Tax=Vespula squamosa TaxID=30214 RepID=A0ABD2BH92_VESSQ
MSSEVIVDPMSGLKVIKQESNGHVKDICTTLEMFKLFELSYVENPVKIYRLYRRENCDSGTKMKDATWVTFYHKRSTDEELRQDNCPKESESRCSW